MNNDKTQDSMPSAERARFKPLIPIIIGLAALAIITGGIVAIIKLSNQSENQISYAENIVEPDEYLLPDSQNGDFYKGAIESISMRFYDGYNIATGDAISDIIPAIEFDLESDEFNVMAAWIKSLNKVKNSKFSESYEHMVYDHISDEFELTINGRDKIYLGYEYGYNAETEDYFEVPSNLYDMVTEISKAHNRRKLLIDIIGEEFTVTSNGHQINLTKSQMAELQEQAFYEIGGTQELFKGETAAYTIQSSNGNSVSVYYASITGQINYADGTTENAYLDGLEDFLENIYKYSR